MHLKAVRQVSETGMINLYFSIYTNKLQIGF